jgi:hypothetical protein
MAGWINRVVIALPRNGTATHTFRADVAGDGTVIAGELFEPTYPRLLVVKIYGAVTSSEPRSGLLEEASAINNGGLYVFVGEAFGEGADSFETSHNGSNYPIIVDIAEYEAGSSYIGDVTATNLGASSAQPALVGVFESDYVEAVRGGNDSTTGGTLPTGTWSGGATTSTEYVDHNADNTSGGTNGYWYTAAYNDNWWEDSGSFNTYQPSNSRAGAVDNAEAASFHMINVEYTSPPTEPTGFLLLEDGTAIVLEDGVGGLMLEG